MWIQNDGVTYEWIKHGRGYLSACNADSLACSLLSLPSPLPARFQHLPLIGYKTANWGRQLPCRRFWVMWAGHKTMLGICTGSLIFFPDVFLLIFFCLSVANKNLTRSNLLWLNLPSVCVGKNPNWRRRRRYRWRKIVWRRLTYDRDRDGSQRQAEGDRLGKVNGLDFGWSWICRGYWKKANQLSLSLFSVLSLYIFL